MRAEGRRRRAGVGVLPGSRCCGLVPAVVAWVPLLFAAYGKAMGQICIFWSINHTRGDAGLGRARTPRGKALSTGGVTCCVSGRVLRPCGRHWALRRCARKQALCACAGQWVLRRCLHRSLRFHTAGTAL